MLLKLKKLEILVKRIPPAALLNDVLFKIIYTFKVSYLHAINELYKKKRDNTKICLSI